ncbi:MAG: hypothetical protein ACYTGE_05675 [Planctomycetota bacterium]|jgi:hypothetical protein
MMPVEGADLVDEVAHLLAYVHGRDVPCPLCGYNLRDLTQARCPECRQDLALTVGVTRLQFGWLIVTIVPSMFSGIAAGLLLIPMLMVLFIGAERPPWPIVAAEAFGWLSTIAALLLLHRRYVFLRQPLAVQRCWGVGAWVVHVGAFVALVASAFYI